MVPQIQIPVGVTVDLAGVRTLTISSLCLGNRKSDIQKFTVLLAHTVGSTPPSAVRHSTPFAIQLVQEFLKEHTAIDIGKVTELTLCRP